MAFTSGATLSGHAHFIYGKPPESGHRACKKASFPTSGLLSAAGAAKLAGALSFAGSSMTEIRTGLLEAAVPFRHVWAG